MPAGLGLCHKEEEGGGGRTTATSTFILLGTDGSWQSVFHPAGLGT